ncbi:lysozyme C-like [Chlorella sorokiniana]|uniref:Lysozyme C-like n=1 Tax=Chlorella sorokiniana TaxID=3076 RepID=A0A2P6TLX9_CHLSO|nr:lysozyme C-like [Chlorella sorokiniana]|eukprot:PRW45334.1 lysozyme C-like [Chlorella sorokiniana]
MRAPWTLLLLAVAAALLAQPAAAWSRHLLQECTNGFLGIGGNQWDNNCNLNFKFTQNNTIDCELDQGPLHSAIKFSCDAGGCTITCDWTQVQDTVPGCAYKSIRSIFDAWHPKSNAAQVTG